MERKSIDLINRRKPSGAAVMRPELTMALFRAFFEEWANSGYAAVSLERVAARAGAGKAAIYRRWPSKLEFACEAIRSVEVMRLGATDQGSLQADIREYLRATRAVLRHPLVRRIIPDLVAERLRSNELSAMLDGIAQARRQFGHRLLDRAVARNELRADLDRELALDLLFTSLYSRMIVRGKNFTKADLDRLGIALQTAIKTC
ncbi:TetR/AcrR family transcriptional regulator C-terminal ligand-binding domain-containing protein [Rhizobiaceae bacterium n13]|uniref:TetR/AcrR family transcriptional regulator C-terminal ligand-binding domain-containing protein n=1 Tax=Ferirhizobium litorale TaxID=2927786 RepID=A0AAE3U2R9_9HYPH|nr:TetR-like C-terminal domain-containing protein [Fererhizobium litorale]MDI7864190.1 TetR/AcrR family transcriptional regulator C-terminal ligand-binding domain-containing protein [Fererhizobium litorale]MDI7923801.1 TetR/AcrR family transcriptional regulator C-terminal ligand-binding domain-containing protein [Fererhizobium litorale]